VPGSTLETYKQALRTRKELNLGHGTFEWVDELCSESVLAYRNGSLLVTHNFITNKTTWNFST
jgi:hypothetical protein